MQTQRRQCLKVEKNASLFLFKKNSVPLSPPSAGSPCRKLPDGLKTVEIFAKTAPHPSSWMSFDNALQLPKYGCEKNIKKQKNSPECSWMTYCAAQGKDRLILSCDAFLALILEHVMSLFSTYILLWWSLVSSPLLRPSLPLPSGSKAKGRRNL